MPTKIDFIFQKAQFAKVVLNRTINGKPHQLEIMANHLSEENKYVQSVTLDGKPVEKPFITYNELISGNKLVFEMGAKPNYNWK